MNDTVTTAFGAVSMGYALIESDRLADWKRFGAKGIGFHLACDEDDLLAFRVDAHARRLIVRRGNAEDFAALGWQVRDDATLQFILERLRGRGIAVEEGEGDEAAVRGVERFWHLQGPKGLSIELFTRPVLTGEPLQMLSGGFITGAAGLGHVAITSRRPEKMMRFWRELFDARLSDQIEEQLGGVTLDVTFLRLNERHHSVAIAATRGVRLDPIRTQVQHFNLLTTSLDEVSAAFRRLRALGFEMAHEIGQHPNDLEVSFYVVTPSGFEMELGCQALTVDEATWKATAYHGISLWGHQPQKASAFDKVALNLGNFKRGARSLLHPEYSPL